MKIRIGSRGSALALAQTNAVAGALRAAGHDVEVIIIQTAGDRDKSAKFADIGAPGVFVREIESALLGNDIDLAVHSYKDLPSRSPEGLVVATIPERLDAADAPADSDERRRYYRITAFGRLVAQAEADRIERLAAMVRERRFSPRSS